MHLIGTLKDYFIRVHTSEITEKIEESRLEIRKLLCCVVLGLLEGAPCSRRLHGRGRVPSICGQRGRTHGGFEIEGRPPVSSHSTVSAGFQIFRWWSSR